MPIRCADDLREACTALSIEVLYSDPDGHRQMTPHAKFNLDDLPEARFTCPQGDCVEDGFYIVDEIAPLIVARQQALQSGTTTDHRLTEEKLIECKGKVQRNGKDYRMCGKMFMVRIRADVK